MSPGSEVIAAGIAGAGLAAALGLAGVLLVRRRAAMAVAARVSGAPSQGEAALLRAAGGVLETAILRLDRDGPVLIGGAETLSACALASGLKSSAAASEVLAALGAKAPTLAAAIVALDLRGERFDLDVAASGGAVRVRGGGAGALALISLQFEPASTPAAVAPAEDGRSLRAFLDAHPWPACIVDDAARPVFANAAWLNAAGVADLDAALAKARSGGLSDLNLAREALAAGEARERVRWTGPSDARRAMRRRATPLAGGGAVIWSWDVTAAEQAREALARRERALELVLGEISDSVALFAPDQRLLHHNPAFARLWDLEPAWLAERPTHGAILDRLKQAGRLPETADYARFKAEELARHQRLDASPETVWRGAGERLLRVVSLPHPEGGLMMVFSDITPEVRLKSQFNHLIQVQQATLDKLTDAVAVFGADARLKLVNEAFAKLFVAPMEALAGEPAFDEVIGRCATRLRDMHFWSELKGRITDPDPGVRAAVRGELALEDGRTLDWQSRPLPDGATLASFADVTGARRLEGALRDREMALDAAEQLKRDFISSVSYELRTPLTTILGYAEMLETGDRSLNERARGWARAVRAAASDLAGSVEDILAFAEIDAGELTLQLAETDVAVLLADALGRWRERAAEADVELRLQPGAPPGLILADAPSLSRVLDHLIGHALRQTPAGGQVRLSARRSAGEVCLEVGDSGRGIPFHVQAHIFDRFSGEEAAGASLGLALVKAIVELHGGWVTLESEPGAGAVFACHLPDPETSELDSEDIPRAATRLA